MAVSKAKPLSFSTTIRNPERIPVFLRCILPFEGKVLTSEVIHEVVKNVIKEKCYKPLYISRNDFLKVIYENEDYSFSDLQLEEIINNSPQNHKEAGFAYGWDSRFDTWYKMIKEFGFIKYAMLKPITITKTGHMLVDAYMEEPCNESKIQKVFLNALMKYQTNNPLRKNLNENVPLPLLLNVIKLLHDDPNESDAGIARQELPILICWRDNNAESVYRYIKDIRRTVGFNCSDEFIYERCLDILENTNKKYLKMEKICHESVDEYIRKMRMSGLLSLRGNGRFLDINRFEFESVKYVIDNYMKYPKFNEEDAYIDYMGDIDSKILQFDINKEFDFSDVRKKTLYEYAKKLSKERVQKELLLVCQKKESKHEVLKYINAPTRLEFLTSIALVQNFKELDVNPNYSVDDEGLPTFTASGGCADIECFGDDCNGLFEVTLMCGRFDQVNNEIIPISRHLREAQEKITNKNNLKKAFSVLIAPHIHSDTKEAAEWQNHKFGLKILTYDINEFISSINKKDDSVLSLLNN